MSDLRIARGRMLFSRLHRAVSQRQRLRRRLTTAEAELRASWAARACASREGSSVPTLLATSVSGAVRGGESSFALRWSDSAAEPTDYWHGGDRWDLDGLRSDLAIEAARWEAMHAHLHVLRDVADDA